MSARALLAAALLAVLLAACSTAPPGGGTGESVPAPPPKEQRRAQPPPAGGGQTLPPAVRGLVAKAASASAAGDNDRAADVLERAVRLAPDNAAVWQNLAVVRYRQDRCDQAIQLARRSSELTDDRRLMARNWRLIAACRRMNGDTEGASEAASRARELGGGQ
ncbi:tetratricopeptide repeat protein [Arhodomonas aquaeolei]|uniref:tetratricopeptide repeat protein n=1 Tax=Arhodomonas aquaeolei TaxID=2369 RepID=UPI0003800236|nr:tetratricopeptide repeat protein [Arhodomonas aquaeolei]